jgi:circadian clock protein KaiB
LIKINPEPVRRLIGDLSDRNKVLAGLNLAPRSSGNALMEL